VDTVRENLVLRGFHLQMPPPPDLLGQRDG